MDAPVFDHGIERIGARANRSMLHNVRPVKRTSKHGRYRSRDMAVKPSATRVAKIAR